MSVEIKASEVLGFLRSDGGYSQIGETYEGITFIDCEPFTKEEYEKGFIDLAEFKANAENEKNAAKQLLLQKLGITEEEAKLLLA